MSAHSIGTLIADLNEKAEAAGCGVRAELIDIDRTWGDQVGVAIIGNGDVERAVRFVQAYSAKHLETRRSYDAQYACRDMGTVGLIRGATDRLYIASKCVGEPEPQFSARIVSLVYYPCAD